MSEHVALTPLDRVEVTVVMDNAIDILAAPSVNALRPTWRWCATSTACPRVVYRRPTCADIAQGCRWAISHVLGDLGRRLAHRPLVRKEVHRLQYGTRQSRLSFHFGTPNSGRAGH